MRSQDVGFLDRDDISGDGPETYALYSGLGDEAVGEYTYYVDYFSGARPVSWNVTVSMAGDILRVDEGTIEPGSSRAPDISVVLDEYVEPSCTIMALAVSADERDAEIAAKGPREVDV